MWSSSRARPAAAPSTGRLPRSSRPTTPNTTGTTKSPSTESSSSSNLYEFLRGELPGGPAETASRPPAAGTSTTHSDDAPVTQPWLTIQSPPAKPQYFDETLAPGRRRSDAPEARLCRAHKSTALTDQFHPPTVSFYRRRSEERRVGKECRSRWSRDH